MSRRPRLTLLVNPSAGRGRAAKRIGQVSDRLRALRPDADLRLQLSTSMPDARARAAKAVAEASEGDALLVMGGDGMVSAGLNACAQTSVPLGIVPAGTGNDFVRGAGLPGSLDAAVSVIAAGHTQSIDLMHVTGHLSDGTDGRWVGCIVSTGFDEKVGQRAAGMRLYLGALNYAAAILGELRTFTPLRYRITVDGVPRSLDANLIAVGNTRFFGGGMQGCPDADPHDGLLDVTIVHPTSRRVLLSVLPRLFDGSFAELDIVERLRASAVTIDGDGLNGGADGEDLGPVPLHAVCVRDALRILAPA